MNLMGGDKNFVANPGKPSCTYSTCMICARAKRDIFSEKTCTCKNLARTCRLTHRSVQDFDKKMDTLV